MKSIPVHRRHVLRSCARAAALAVPGWAGAARASSLAAAPAERALALQHLHTRERIAVVYAEADTYVPPALEALNRFLRDHYTGDVGVMDPQLFDLLHRVRAALGGRQVGLLPFEVISGYRCPATNQHLKQTRGGGVAQRSLHMDGRAIDVRLPGVPLAELRDAARSLKAGGVGYYPRDQFVHLDTGRTRHW
ncbi:MAG: DUF882 domain-containing protein [Hylemonella sp.]|nr:DUF882 domain-containing protein [Hylemonella sp.]